MATGSTLNSLLCLSFNRNKNFAPGASFGNLERVRDQAPATPAIDPYSYSGTDIASSGCRAGGVAGATYRYDVYVSMRAQCGVARRK